MGEVIRGMASQQLSFNFFYGEGEEGLIFNETLFSSREL